MSQKSKGGRGKRAEHPYVRLTITLPPEQVQRLDELAAELGIENRSALVSRIIGEYRQDTTSLPTTALPSRRQSAKRNDQAQELQASAVASVTSNPQKESEAPYRPSGEPVKRTPRASTRAGGVKRTATERLAHSVPVLNVMQRTVPRGLGWKPERYEQTEKLLGHGDSLKADGVNYRTAKGEVVGYKTVEALVRLGVLVQA